MVQPIQYGIQAPSAFESLVSGLRLGTSLREMQAQQALREQQALKIQSEMALAQEKAQKEQQREVMLQDFYRKVRNNESLTTTDWLEFGENANNPEYRNLAKDSVNRMTEDEQSARAGDIGKMMAALWNSPDIGLKIAQDYKAANPNDKGFDPILKLAETRPKEAAVMLFGMMSGKGGKFEAVAKNLANVLGMEAKKPEATPEILRAIDALGLPRNLESIKKYSEATQRPEAMTALQKAQAYRQTLQQQGKQNSPEYAENEQYIRNQLVDPTALTQAQIEANRIAQARLEQAERLNDPLYQENLAAAKARGTAAGEEAAGKEALKNASIATLSSIGYNPATGEDNVSRLISQSTGGGLGATADAVARYFGEATRGAAAINTLKAVSADMTLNVLGGKLGAGISNPDRDFIEKRFGEIGNENLSRAERYAAWQAAKNRMVQIGMLPKPQPRGAAQQQTQTPQPAPAGGAPRQPTVRNW